MSAHSARVVPLVAVVEGLERQEIEPTAAGSSDAGFPVFDYPRDVAIVSIHVWLNQADGGGGNRTRVRSRTVKSISKLSLPLNFARPAGGLANLPSG